MACINFLLNTLAKGLQVPCGWLKKKQTAIVTCKMDSGQPHLENGVVIYYNLLKEKLSISTRQLNIYKNKTIN